MDPPCPPSPPSGPPRGTCASRRNVAAPPPPSPARTQIFTRSRNIAPIVPRGRRGAPGPCGLQVPERVDPVRAALPGIADPDLEVAMWPGGHPGHPDSPDLRSTTDALA